MHGRFVKEYVGKKKYEEVYVGRKKYEERKKKKLVHLVVNFFLPLKNQTIISSLFSRRYTEKKNLLLQLSDITECQKHK